MFLMVACLTLIFTVLHPMLSAAEYKDNINKTFTVREGGSLIIKSDLGAIDVKTGKSDKVAIHIIREIKNSGDDEARDVLANLDISMKQRGNDVLIETKYDRGTDSFFSLFFRRPNLSLRYEITVPEKYDMDLKTGGGSVSVADITGTVTCNTSGGKIDILNINGQVTAKTSGGSISLEGSTGDADLHTSGGSIKIGSVEGNIEAYTSGGRIEIIRAGGNVKAHTSGGSVRIEEVNGVIDASTSGGSIDASIMKQPASDCRLASSGGSISVNLNPQCKLSVNASTSGGGVRTDIPMTFTGEISKNKLIADMNGGGPELYLRTSGGRINLNKK